MRGSRRGFIAPLYPVTRRGRAAARRGLIGRMALKDRLFETVALPLLNRSLLAPYGKARELRLNSREHTAEIVLELNGEPEPLHVRVGSYELSRIGEETFVTLRDVETSRAWMTELALRNLVGRALKIPREYAGMIGKLGSS